MVPISVLSSLAAALTDTAAAIIQFGSFLNLETHGRFEQFKQYTHGHGAASHWSRVECILHDCSVPSERGGVRGVA